jgi:hypothetical protein
MILGRPPPRRSSDRAILSDASVLVCHFFDLVGVSESDQVAHSTIPLADTMPETSAGGEKESANARMRCRERRRSQHAMRNPAEEPSQPRTGRSQHAMRKTEPNETKRKTEPNETSPKAIPTRKSCRSRGTVAATLIATKHDYDSTATARHRNKT